MARAGRGCQKGRNRGYLMQALFFHQFTAGIKEISAEGDGFQALGAVQVVFFESHAFFVGHLAK
jgi:hypothetical protein